MSIKTALYSVLTAHAGVSALVDDRVYPNVIPQRGEGPSRMPAIVYRQGTTDRQKTYCGTDGTRRDSFTVDAYSVTHDGADSLADAIEAALIDYRGIAGGRFIADVFLTSRGDLGDIDPGRYRVSLSFDIWHRAST